MDSFVSMPADFHGEENEFRWCGVRRRRSKPERLSMKSMSQTESFRMHFGIGVYICDKWAAIDPNRPATIDVEPGNGFREASPI